MLDKYFDDKLSTTFDKFYGVQEIRLRLGKKISVTDRTGKHLINIVVTPEFIEKTFCSMCNYSVYAVQEEIKNGFITLSEGHRVGLCGRCIINDGKVKNISEISGINIRIAREVKGCATSIYEYIKGRIENTIIISPPNCGKTTYLREITRLVSNDGYNVTVVDERGELAPCYDGKTWFDLGENTDVLRYCPKHIGMMMVLRTMNPEIIVTDETGAEKESEAIFEIAKCGVKIFTTFHGYGVDDMKARLKGWEKFFYAVTLNRRKEVENIFCLK